MISSLTWVPKGASKSKPLRFEVSQAELEEIMRGQGGDSMKDGEEEGEEEGAPGSVDVEVEEGKAAESATGHGGGGAEVTSDAELPEELRMDEYDDEPDLPIAVEGGGVDVMDEDEDGDEEGEEEKEAQEGFRFMQEPTTGQVFAYESEEDSDAEDNIIKPTDNVLLTASTDEDEHSTLEVQVYSEETGNLYVHHDIALPSLPLCLAWMDMPPRTAAMSLASGSPDEGHTVGSYCAVGTFEPAIEIWNLDVLDPLEPTATLGGYKDKDKKPGKKARKRTVKPGSHTDAVLSLSWNREHRHVLASGSGDNSVKLWDVTTQQCSATLTHHDDKVKEVTWHPVEATVMATLGYDRVFALLDARVPTKVTKHSLQADPECLLWNPHNPAQVLSGSEDGVVCCRDVRRTDTPMYSFTAHERGVSAVSFSPRVPGMLATCSEDKTVRVWDVDAEVPLQIASKAMDVGKLFTLQYEPSSAFLLSTAGSKGHVALWHSDDDEAVSARFSGRVTGGATATTASAERGELEGILTGAREGELQDGLGEAGGMTGVEAGGEVKGAGEGGAGAGAGATKKKKKKKKN